MLLTHIHTLPPVADELHLEIRPKAFPHPDAAALEFGLHPLGPFWRQIDLTTATDVLFALLIADMAHSSPRLTPDQARAAIAEFLTQFTPEAAYFTNGNWEEGHQKSKHSNISFGPDWHPATDATFDGGVLVLDQIQTGILWLEDED